MTDLYRLVPTEVTAAHERVRAAADRPGIVDRRAALTVADDVLLEVAAMLAGRAPDGPAQQQHVVARTRYLGELAVALDERGDAWQQAVTELDAEWPEVLAPPAAPGRDRDAVTVLVVLLSPFFVAWDVVVGAARGSVALVPAVARRVRAAWDAALGAVTGLLRSVVAAARRWRTYRDRVRAAFAEARARMIAARLRLRIRLRRLRSRRRGV